MIFPSIHTMEYQHFMHLSSVSVRLFTKANLKAINTTEKLTKFPLTKFLKIQSFFWKIGM